MGEEVDKEFVDNLTDKTINELYNNIVSVTTGLNLTEYQLIAMTSRAYNCGVNGATYTRNGKTFKEAYSEYWNQEEDDLYEAKNKDADFNHKLYTTYMNEPTTSEGEYLPGLERRRKAEWTLFQTGYFDVLNVWYEEKGKIVEIADEMAKIMSNEGWTYCVGGCNSYEECGKFGKSHCLNNTFEQARNGSKTTCCATFVSWVLQEAGYLTDSEHTNSSTALYKCLKTSKGFIEIKNISELQPGDILFYDYNSNMVDGLDHVEIYAGDGKSYSAGSGNCIRGNVPKVWNGWMSYAFRAPDV